MNHPHRGNLKPHISATWFIAVVSLLNLRIALPEMSPKVFTVAKTDNAVFWVMIPTWLVDA
jgi:hypothetical protein